MTKAEWKTKVEGGDIEAIGELIKWVKKNLDDDYKEFVLSANTTEPYYWLDFYFDAEIEFQLEKISQLKSRLQGRITRTQIGFNSQRNKLNLGLEMKKYSLIERETPVYTSSSASSSPSSSSFSSTSFNNQKYSHHPRHHPYNNTIQRKKIRKK